MHFSTEGAIDPVPVLLRYFISMLLHELSDLFAHHCGQVLKVLRRSINAITVVPNRFNGTAPHGFHAQIFLFWGRWLLENDDIIPLIAAPEIIRCCFLAEITVDTLIVCVEDAGGVLGVSVLDVGHGIRDSDGKRAFLQCYFMLCWMIPMITIRKKKDGGNHYQDAQTSPLLTGRNPGRGLVYRRNRNRDGNGCSRSGDRAGGWAIDSRTLITASGCICATEGLPPVGRVNGMGSGIGSSDSVEGAIPDGIDRDRPILSDSGSDGEEEEEGDADVHGMLWELGCC